MSRAAVSAVLLAAACALVAGAGARASGGALTIDAAADNHPISPLIYGMSNADPALAAQVSLPVNRYGGNLADTYNWQTDTFNTGSDWYFENIPGCWNSDEGWCSSPPASPATRYRSWIDSDRSAGAKTLLVLPLMGQVAAPPPTYDHPFVCGFPRTANNHQDGYDPYDTNCGNGQVGGVQIAPPAPPDWIAAGASWNAGWLADIVGHFGRASSGGVAFYGLGNEPGLWDWTHHDMHPAPETYDELWQKSRDTALAVRSADPTAQILAFSEWGWPNYFCSAADDVSQGCSATSPDRAAHGGTPLVTWLLQQAQAYQTAHGVRLFDYLDVHYYPQGGSAPGNLRSLYDPSYVDPSWIGDTIDLIPRMHQWVNGSYPGTKLAISEWDWGHNNDTQGVLTDAEVLGIFAREQVDLAAKWAPPSATDAAANAWRIYRNYDGAHHGFGDTWVRSTSTVSGLQAFAAKRAADGALTVLVANDGSSSVTAPLTVANATLGGAAQVWRWQQSPGTIQHLSDQAVSSGGFSATYPARSLTLFVLVPGSGGGGGGGGGGSGGGGGGSAPASISLSPSSGKKKSTFKVKGASFHGGSLVTVRWGCSSAPCNGASSLGSTAAAADGSFSLSVTVPSNAAKGLTSVGALDASGAFAKASFKVK